MDNDRLKRAVGAGWDAMSDSYQADSVISLHDVHYGPFCAGESELNLMGDVRGRRVLELACGAAQNSIALARKGALVTAIDISPRQLDKAAALVRQEGVTVDLLRADMESLGMFRDGAFEVVLSSFGWEFVPELGACLRECRRVLVSDGLLVMCTVHPLTAFEWDEEERALIVDNYFDPPVEVWNETGTGPDAVTYFHTIDETFQLLRDANFGVERIVEPCPKNIKEMTPEELASLPYRGSYWESQYERLSRVPFSIVYVATAR